jgi:hypothetical protein
VPIAPYSTRLTAQLLHFLAISRVASIRHQLGLRESVQLDPRCTRADWHQQQRTVAAAHSSSRASVASRPLCCVRRAMVFPSDCSFSHSWRFRLSASLALCERRLLSPASSPAPRHAHGQLPDSAPHPSTINRAGYRQHRRRYPYGLQTPQQASKQQPRRDCCHLPP